jgi:hypothetical protein
MDADLEKKIEKTVVEILKASNMDDTTEFQVRKSAAEKLGIDLSQSDRKKFVRKVVESYLDEQQEKADQAQQADEDEQAQEEEEEEDNSKKRKKAGAKEFDDDGDLIICRLSDKRRVTVTDFKGKTLLSIREYYKKDNKELPTAKGISLTAEQWSTFKKNLPAIEKAVKKMESRLN